MTTNQWNLPEAVAGCKEAGIPAIGLWRHKVDEVGLKKAASLVREAGLRVSSLCRGGMFPAATEAERQKRLDDNRRAIDEAAELGTDVLVLVLRARPADRNIARAPPAGGRRHREFGPLRRGTRDHAGYRAAPPDVRRRSVGRGHAGPGEDLIAEIGAPNVGVVIDVYHVWGIPNSTPRLSGREGGSSAFT